MATIDPGGGDSSSGDTTKEVEKERSSSFARARFTIFGKRPSKPSALKESVGQREAKDTVENVLTFHNGFSEQIVDVLDRPERMAMQIWAVFFALVGFFASSYATELIHNNELEVSEEAEKFKLVVTISTAFLIISVLRMHMYDCNVEKERGYISPSSSIFSLGRHTNIYQDLLICAIHASYLCHFVLKEKITGQPQEAVNSGEIIPVYAYHTLDALANTFMSARLYLLAPLIHHFLGLTGPGPRVVARFTNIIFDMNFSLKAVLERHGLMSLLGSIFVFAAHGAWLFKILERSVCVVSQETIDTGQWNHVADIWGFCGQHQTGAFENYLDSLWCAIVTMTTVGYGDMSPVTLLGRCVSIYLSLLGIVILSLLVNVMTELTTFRPRERKAFDLISRGVYRERTRLLAAKLLQSAWRMHYAKKNRAMTVTNSMAKTNYYKCYRRWKENLRLMLVNENKIDEVAILTTELSSLRRDFKDLMFTSIVDLEERMDRRIERLAWLIQHNQKEIVTHMSSRHLEGAGSGVGSRLSSGDRYSNRDKNKEDHAPFNKIVSGIPTQDVMGSMEHVEDGQFQFVDIKERRKTELEAAEKAQDGVVKERQNGK